uniref:Reverse transcriptase Ty1/copia-type domain-containing protein n=1 Tax=Quercus lobata TaxID=97700 RepID=A0A7N2LTQ0_QUELO
MSPEIMKRYLRLHTAREIWSALAKAFYDGSNETQLFALNQRAFTTKQAGRPLSTYYGELVKIFQELDYRDKVIMKDPNDIVTYKKSVARLRVHIFHSGLDVEFEQIRGEVLRKDPSMDLDDTYAYGSYEIGAPKPERLCTYCGETGHTKARCYDLIGYPDWWDLAKASRKRNSKPNHNHQAFVAVTKPSDDVAKASSLIATSGNIGKDLKKYLQEHGISHQTTCPYSPQQNGVAELLSVAAYLINHVPSSSLNFQTPFEVLHSTGERQNELQTLNLNPSLDHLDTSGQFLDKSGECLEEETICPEEETMLREQPILDQPDVSLNGENNQNQLEVTPLQEALGDPRWKEAMNEEMKSLQKNSTWKVVELPEGKKPVGCRWVFTVKYKADETIERFKARLVAKVYTQTYGIDYMETFAPVAKINTVRILISLAVNLDWPLHQFDVKNAFFHEDPQEEVYMELPPGCNMQLEVTGNDSKERRALQNHLAREFEMKDLGPLKYFLGIEVSRSKEGVFLSQRKYALDLLSEIGMMACSLVSTPMEENLKLGIYPDQVPTNKERYQRLVERLMYLSHTRPDLAYALSSVNAVTLILRYLKSSPRKGIMFKKGNNLDVKGYIDADWAGSIKDRQSTAGYFTFVGGNLVTWRSKK